MRDILRVAAGTLAPAAAAAAAGKEEQKDAMTLVYVHVHAFAMAPVLQRNTALGTTWPCSSNTRNSPCRCTWLLPASPARCFHTCHRRDTAADGAVDRADVAGPARSE